MESAERTLNVLVVDRRAHEMRLIEQTLADFGHDIAVPEDTHHSLVDAVADYLPDIVIIGIDSPDPAILAEIRDVAPTRPVLLFTNDGGTDSIRAAIESGVAAYVVDGIKPSRIGPIIDAAIVRFEVFRALRHELDQAKHAARHRRQIEIAKGMLMSRHGLDERAAHRRLLKTAMERNMKLPDVADEVVRGEQSIVS